MSGSEKSLVNWFRDPSVASLCQDDRFVWFFELLSPAELSPPLFIEEGDRLRWRSLHEERFDAVSRVEFARGALFQRWQVHNLSFRTPQPCGQLLFVERGALYSFLLLTATRQFVVLSGSEKSLVNWFRDPSRSFRMTGSCGSSTPHRYAAVCHFERERKISC